MLRAAIVEKSKEHREYIRASLTGINMDIQVSEYADEYDYLDDLNEDASSFDILLLNTTIHREGDGLELAAKVRARSRKVMICFITDSQRYYAEAFSVFATGYLLYPFDVSELHNCITFFWQKPTMERRASLMLKEAGGSFRRVYCRNILYVESANRKVILHLENGETIESYAKLDELEALLGKYVPGAEALRTKLKKYDAAYKALTAKNAALEKQLGATSKESVLKKLEINEKLRELDELHRMVDGIPPEILQAAKQVAAHKPQER